MAITVATQRVSLQIFLQSSIRWVRQSKLDSSILQNILPDLLKSESLLIKYALVVCGICLQQASLSSYLSARVLPLYVLSNLLCIPLFRWGFVNDGSLLFPEVIFYDINAVILSWFQWKDITVSIFQGSLRLILNLVSTFSFSNTWFLLLLGPPPSITSW